MKNSFTSISAGFLAMFTVFTAGFANTALAAENSGSWSKAAFSTSGTWSIEGRTLTLTDFSTKSAPDLKIILSPHSVDDLQSRNAMTGAVIISPLKSNKGTQTYEIPENVDLADFESIGIHCQKYTKLFAKSSL
ncbi:MAG: DM13 domain-containing protein [Verrucomicrobiota bacterium]